MYVAAQQLHPVPCLQPIAPGAALNTLKNLGLFGLSETLWVGVGITGLHTTRRTSAARYR